MDHNYEDDILQIQIDCDAIIGESMSEDLENGKVMEDNGKENNYINDTIMLKMFKKGLTPLVEYRTEILKYLTEKVKMNIVGFFLCSTSSVLVEVEINKSLEIYLLTAYEDRIGWKLQREKSTVDIIKMCHGKFLLNIGNTFVYFTVIHNKMNVNLLCKTSHPILGFHNGSISNLLLGKFEKEDEISLFDIFTVMQSTLLRNSFDGIQLHSFEDESESLCVRLLVNVNCLSNMILIELNKLFGIVRFSCNTLHVFAERDKKSIVDQFNICTLSESLKLIKEKDLIVIEQNCLSKSKRVAIHHFLNSSTSKNKDEKSSNRKSIFDRLGKKISNSMI